MSNEFIGSPRFPHMDIPEPDGVRDFPNFFDGQVTCGEWTLSLDAGFIGAPDEVGRRERFVRLVLVQSVANVLTDDIIIQRDGELVRDIRAAIAQMVRLLELRASRAIPPDVRGGGVEHFTAFVVKFCGVVMDVNAQEKKMAAELKRKQAEEKAAETASPAVADDESVEEKD